MRCVVCSLESPTARERRTASGTRYGVGCDDCHGLLWEAHFVKATKADVYEHALVAWQWRKRRAEALGLLFREAAPESPAERTLNRILTERGLMGVAQEMA